MTKASNGRDKNLANTIDALNLADLPAHANNQRNQDKSDRRHQDKLNVASQWHEAEQNHQTGES